MGFLRSRIAVLLFLALTPLALAADGLNPKFNNVRLLGSTSGTTTLQPSATAGTGTLTLPANTTSTLTSRADNLSAFSSTTSSQLAGVISDETGSGALCFATAPTFIGQVTTYKDITSGANFPFIFNTNESAATSDPRWLTVAGRGTYASPSAIQSGDALFQLDFNGVDTTTANNGSNNIGAYISVNATENFSASPSRHGAKMAFGTTANSGGATATALTIENTGQVSVSPTSLVDSFKSEGAANRWAGVFNNTNSGGQSYGLVIQAGSTNGDYALDVSDRTGSALVRVHGDGSIVATSLATTVGSGVVVASSTGVLSSPKIYFGGWRGSSTCNVNGSCSGASIGLISSVSRTGSGAYTFSYSSSIISAIVCTASGSGGTACAINTIPGASSGSLACGADTAPQLVCTALLN